MGLDSRRIPLPAPTDVSSADNDTTVGFSDDVATDVSRRTDRTSYSIPEDGRPITISTKPPRHSRHESATSLLIEYFDGGESGEGLSSRPSVRVRVTPSKSKKNDGPRAGIRITETTRGSNSGSRRAAYTRRISIPRDALEASELSALSEAESSSHPIEVDIAHSEFSDFTQRDSSPTRFIPAASDISSMPPDSMLDGSTAAMRTPPRRRRSRSAEREETIVETLKTPSRRRSRSLSRERMAHNVARKLQETQSRPRESSKHKHKSSREHRDRSRSASKEYIFDDGRSPKRAGKYRDDDRLAVETQPSEISTMSGLSVRSEDKHSTRSGASNVSINNPKLLKTVEDAIRRLILPELDALKEEQRTQKNRMKFEEITRDPKAPAGSRSRDNIRRVSKSSSSPNVAGQRPEIHADDRGVIYAGDSPNKLTKSRRSSRESSERSHDTIVRETSRKSSREKRHEKEVAAAAGAAVLTAAALRHHDSVSSHGDVYDTHERRKRRSKSRSRSASISESIDSPQARHLIPNIPPLPMQSMIDSDLTRDSIMSAETAEPHSRGSPAGLRSPLHETPPRRSPRQGAGSPLIPEEPRTPTRTPDIATFRDGSRTPESRREISTWQDSRTADSSRKDVSTFHESVMSPGQRSVASAKSDISKGETSAKRRAREIDLANTLAARSALKSPARENRPHTPTRGMSPANSTGTFDDLKVASLEYPTHNRVRSIKSGESMSPRRKNRGQGGGVSIDTLTTTQSTNVARSSKKRPEGVSLEKRFEILPDGESEEGVDEWLHHEHQRNDRYREEFGSQLTEEDPAYRHSHGATQQGYSEVSENDDDKVSSGHDIREIRANPEYVHTPVAVESAVASLHGLSDMSANSPHEWHGSQAESFSRAQMPSSSRERYEMVREQAIESAESPRQSEARSADDRPLLDSSALPLMHDPLPDFGHSLETESDVTTNPSIIRGPIGGLDHDDRDHWPYEPTPPINNGRMPALHGDLDGGAAMLSAAAGVGLGLNSPSPNAQRRDLNATVETDPDDYYDGQQGATYGYSGSPGHLRDEGYMSSAPQAGLSPSPYAGRTRGVDEASLGSYGATPTNDNNFAGTRHIRHESGLSHGMESPLYDGAMGRGMDAIESRDIVALMDHLTVRDAQRNARDTEILVTLVRNAAEMRTGFEEMKKYIAEQDRLIMNNNEMTAQRLAGPRPYPSSTSPRQDRRQLSSEKSMANRNIFQRALKGLSLKSSNDLTKIENMLMHLLDEVEGLKATQQQPQAHIPPSNTTRSNSVNSYENLSKPQDPGYEPEGQAGTSSPAQSGYLSNSSSRGLSLPAMHSSYERRGVEAHRISTVPEEDSDEYEDERLLTPTQEARNRGPPPQEIEETSPQEHTPRMDKSKKHRSNTSSIFSNFRGMSRWSKTTTASTVPDSARKDAPRPASAHSAHSRSGSNLNLPYDYALGSADRLRSRETLPRASGESARAPSPLIPDDSGAQYDNHTGPPSPPQPEDEYDPQYDDPKYQAHRNSLNLQHPQPRPGPTHRHQSYLESAAIAYENPPTPDAADQWGTTPALSRARFNPGQSGLSRASPAYGDEDAWSAHSAEAAAPARPPKVREDPNSSGPLVPPKIALDVNRPPPAVLGYTSPLSAGVHVGSPLEPIEEVRYSLETDGGGVRGMMTPSPRPTAMQSVTRKITGPREMPGRNGARGGSASPAGQVRRKPVGGGGTPESYRNSWESETF
ncbi:hypothetical protein EJ06DRAFT_557248 [Trichodelitschia bisporula]|uniref:Uncharacterized protein n=1 Tax=Trichodelitschia bisporula TaxID=703511 RepID=A0A6G1HU05_9PEZI|nr:hypothetical protein EJ06DRAFT_557248 [Trichodelitschia bisporula]